MSKLITLIYEPTIERLDWYTEIATILCVADIYTKWFAYKIPSYTIPHELERIFGVENLSEAENLLEEICQITEVCQQILDQYTNNQKFLTTEQIAEKDFRLSQCEFLLTYLRTKEMSGFSSRWLGAYVSQYIERIELIDGMLIRSNKMYFMTHCRFNLSFLRETLKWLNLTKQEAYQLMLLGFKVTNKRFFDDEYLHYFEGVRTEEGYLMDNFFDKDYLPEVSWQVKIFNFKS